MGAGERTSYRCAFKRKESNSPFKHAWNVAWRLNEGDESFVFTAGSRCHWSPHDECLKTPSQRVWAEFTDGVTLRVQLNHSTKLTHSTRSVCFSQSCAPSKPVTWTLHWDSSSCGSTCPTCPSICLFVINIAIVNGQQSSFTVHWPNQGCFIGLCIFVYML